MNQYVFGAICLAVLIAFGSFYLTSDLGGNSHFDKAGENWKRKWAVTISKEKLLNHLSQFLNLYNNRVTAVQAYQDNLHTIIKSCDKICDARNDSEVSRSFVTKIAANARKHKVKP